MTTTWRKLIGEQMADIGDSWANIQGVAPDHAALDVVFDDGFGGVEGPAFTVWTLHNVYFPICYDGAESVGFG